MIYQSTQPLWAKFSPFIHPFWFDLHTVTPPMMFGGLTPLGSKCCDIHQPCLIYFQTNLADKNQCSESPFLLVQPVQSSSSLVT